MGQKIHPVGFRLGIIRGHDSHWICPKRHYRDLVLSDYKIRKYLRAKIGKGLVSRVEIGLHRPLAVDRKGRRLLWH